MNKRIISIPPNYFYLCVIISILFYFFFPQMNLIDFPITLLGIPLIVFGLYLVIKSYYLFKKHSTSEKFEKSTCVVRMGLYRYSRNPMYLGGVVCLVGLSTFLGNMISFLSPILFFALMNWMFIPFEEEKMKRELGKEYLNYKNQARRWFGEYNEKVNS